MKAILRTQYGPPDLLQFAEVATPVPGEREVMIKLCAAAVNPLDLYLMKGAPWDRMPGLRRRKPMILGCDVAGRVEAVGKAVNGFQAGDEVFGVTGFKGQGFAEYVCVAEENLGPKPGNLTFEEAAAVPVAAITALQGLRDKGRIRPGSKVLVEGASGGVGTFAVQIAKAFGADVTAVCSTRNVEIARSIGADRVIDYTKEDFTRDAQRYDLILGANAHHSILDYRSALTENGVYVAAGGGLFQIFEVFVMAPVLSRMGRKKMGFFLTKVTRKDLDFMKDLLESGKVVPVIDRRYRLSEAAEALRYLAEGHAQGKIVLTVSQRLDI
ncbi:NAD(P)-dependent alcohol dehydrogenase [Tunturibacter empetritectus]|uniref:NADPH:quinone reductase-like Zn-dependent oxidoreductase n=1 Tax=Tunturiibacter empetritectus TaxID=3069691 RepID=A0A7W8IEY3_9BACT|nr:NAD(P)-dependent alcohol dehydrogenase [Edaphobacter lichenicola]MBB5315963.1 NADPH:quinone reductase-like Zn-dependent oxidoreductase [Edaphobacter lichenicola]